MLDVFKEAEDDCKIMGENWSWDRIEQIVEAWENPAAYSFRGGEGLVINDRNIMTLIQQAVDSY